MGWGFDSDEPPAKSQRLLLKADGGERQAARVVEIVRGALAAPESFRLTSDTICELHELAMRGLITTAGRFRNRSDVVIRNSTHKPPPHEFVPCLVDAACAFVSAGADADPVFVGSFILWWLCWVHPFDNGNGRTARAVSYLVVSVRMGVELPDARPFPARFKAAPIAYRRALEASDKACAEGRIDVTKMQGLLAFYLEAQLRGDPAGLPPGS